MTAPKEFGGRGFSQMAYCKMLEEIGAVALRLRFSRTRTIRSAFARCSFSARDEQKAKMAAPLVTGEQLAAFALTEEKPAPTRPMCRCRREPSEDGSHYILNGEKRYITNASIAQVLTVMARTPVPGSDKTAITAFLVTPDMPGFTMLEPRMPKLGIRGTATGRFALRDVRGAEGKYSRPARQRPEGCSDRADFGRTTFGACCTGAAKTCLRSGGRAREHAPAIQQNLGDFDLVKKKIARMAADIYAMEAMTAVTASLIDRGLEDYMMETAMLKVFTTERCGMRSMMPSRFTAARPISTTRRSSGCCATRGSIRSAKEATKC